MVSISIVVVTGASAPARARRLRRSKPGRCRASGAFTSIRSASRPLRRWRATTAGRSDGRSGPPISGWRAWPRSATAFRVAVLDAQTRPSTVFAAPGAGTAWHAHVILLDCSPDVRAARLRGPRGQGELATPRMDCWAAYLRGQADALRLPVIDTTGLTVVEVARQLEAAVRRLTDSDAPAA